MTTKEKLIKSLVNKGMSESQAKEVIELAIPEINKLSNDYSITWERPFEEYPEIMYHLWWMIIKPIALKWIDENKPMAWFREMFVTPKQPTI